MDSITTTIIGGVISLCVSVIAGVAIHRTNKARDSIDKAVNDIIVLQNTAVNDSHVRRVVKEELQPLAANSEKVLEGMHKIQIFIAEQKGYTSARLEAKRSRASDTPL